MSRKITICLRSRLYQVEALHTNVNILRKSSSSDMKYFRSFGSQHGEAQTGFKDKSNVGSTVDQNEIIFHGNMKDEWWHVNGPAKGLHAMNRLRVPFIRDGLLACFKADTDSTTTGKPLRGLKILDVGCGGGILSEPLARLGADVTGIDACADLIEVAKEHASVDETLVKDQITYIATSIEEHAEQVPEKYDGVVASEIIDHVTNKELFVEACVKTLKPGGSIFFSTMNRTQEVWFSVIILAENVLNIVPKGTHEWSKFITPEEIICLLEKNKCEPMVLHGMIYLFVNNKWYWTSNRRFFYIMQAIKKRC